MKTCYICREETDVLNKICVCEDSYICNDCLEISDENINDETNFNEKAYFLGNMVQIFIKWQ